MTSIRDQVLARAEVRTVAANGLRHRVLSFGDGARDLVLVPGITSPAETAEFITEALPEYTLHVPDLRGRGGSDRSPSGSYALGDYRADLAGILDALALDGPVIVGHSLGARIVAAWSASDEGADVPTVLVDPPLSRPGRPYPMSASSFARQLAQAQFGTTADEVRTYFPHWPERELRLRAEVLAGCDETAVLETHRGFETEDVRPIWDRLRGHVALVRGADSPVVTDEDVDELRRRNSRVPVVTVPGAGHMVPWDNLTGFVEALRRVIPDNPHHHPTKERNTR